MNHRSVNGRHAYLQAIAGRLFCVDMKSKNGVVWERGREPSGWVDGRRGVRIGPLRIRAEGGAEPVGRKIPSRRDPRTSRATDRHPGVPPGTRPAPLATGPRPDLDRSRPRLPALHGGPRGIEVPLQSAPHSRGGLDRQPSRTGWDQGQRPARPLGAVDDRDQIQVGPYLFQIHCEGTSADRSRVGKTALGALTVLASPPGWPSTPRDGDDGPTARTPGPCPPVVAAAREQVEAPRQSCPAGSRARRTRFHPDGGPVRPDAAADVRSVPAGHDDDDPGLRVAPTRAAGADP